MSEIVPRLGSWLPPLRPQPSCSRRCGSWCSAVNQEALTRKKSIRLRFAALQAMYCCTQSCARLPTHSVGPCMQSKPLGALPFGCTST